MSTIATLYSPPNLEFNVPFNLDSLLRTQEKRTTCRYDSISYSFQWISVISQVEGSLCMTDDKT